MKGAGFVKGDFLGGARLCDEGAGLGAANAFTIQRDESALSNPKIDSNGHQLIRKSRGTFRSIPSSSNDKHLLSSSGMVKRDKAIAI